MNKVLQYLLEKVFTEWDEEQERFVDPNHYVFYPTKHNCLVEITSLTEGSQGYFLHEDDGDFYPCPTEFYNLIVLVPDPEYTKTYESTLSLNQSHTGETK